MRSGMKLIGVGCLILLTMFPALATGVKSRAISTAPGFQPGTLEGTAIDAQGRVRLAPSLDTLWGPAEGIVWAVEAAEGGAVWVALSDPGRVFLVSVNTDADAEPVIWQRVHEDSLVTALLHDGQGGVFLGLSPEGAVYHISGPEQIESTVETGAAFIWDLEHAEGDSLWVATGMPGNLLRLSADGGLETVYESNDDPVRTIATLPDGAALIGTGGRGLVIRVDASGKPFVLLDAVESEVVDLVVAADGTIFALTASGAKQVSSNTAPAKTAAKNENNTIEVVATAPKKENDSPHNGNAKPKPPIHRRLTVPAGGSLYRIDTDGMVHRIWQVATEIPFALEQLADGRLLVATGDTGRIYLLNRQGEASRLLRIASNQASALSVGSAGTIFIGGTSDARLDVLGLEARKTGAYLSPALDAGTLADWGEVHWEAQLPARAALRVLARAGNTSDPDETWSDWVLLGDAERRSGSGQGLPPTRWFQVKVEMEAGKGASPSLSRVEVFFLPRNRVPEIRALAVELPGIVWVKGPLQQSNRGGPVVANDPVARQTSVALRRKAPTAPIRKLYEQGARSINWTVEDADQDRLVCSLQLRLEGSDDWFPLASDLTDSFFSWDARAYADGLYRARLLVEDALDNPDGKQLVAEKLSSAFLIDNTRPTIEDVTLQDVTLEFSAADPGGTIAAVEMAIGGGEWTVLDSLDGVADSGFERYRLTLTDGKDAMTSLMLRVTDSAGNLGGEMVWLTER
jgi:hypothetical protein